MLSFRQRRGSKRWYGPTRRRIRWRKESRAAIPWRRMFRRRKPWRKIFVPLPLSSVRRGMIGRWIGPIEKCRSQWRKQCMYFHRRNVRRRKRYTDPTHSTPPPTLFSLAGRGSRRIVVVERCKSRRGIWRRGRVPPSIRIALRGKCSCRRLRLEIRRRPSSFQTGRRSTLYFRTRRPKNPEDRRSTVRVRSSTTVRRNTARHKKWNQIPQLQSPWGKGYISSRARWRSKYSSGTQNTVKVRRNLKSQRRRWRGTTQGWCCRRSLSIVHSGRQSKRRSVHRSKFLWDTASTAQDR